MAEPTSAADNQILKPHSNAIVPHKIANHDTEAVQLNVWNGTEWVNIYDGNDMRNMNIDLHKVSKVVEKHAAEIPAVESAANSAVEQAESAVSASKVNSEAIAAQSEAVSEAKSAISSANAAIQQTAANAASDAAKIRADVVQVQSEIDANKAANSASVEALKSDVSAAKQDLADVHDRLDQAQSAIEQNQKLINDSVVKITSDVSATKQDLADVHDSLTKAQAAAEQNQKAINQSIAQINSDVDGTKQDLAGVRKDLTKAQADITANQKSINDNVAKINADITQDRKGIASAQQANADTAKQLDTYSKQATEQSKTIKTIQDKQDGFTATLADVQGNVSQVSDKVDGLSASLKDAQGNVASVKAQADQLSATLTDHAKSIATLTASAKELSSTLEDADGRLSKVEQTAQTNSSTLSDVQGDLSQVKQNATKLVSTLKDAQGNISTLQQKADSLSTQLASAQGDIATLQTGIDGVKAILTSHDKSIHTLQADSKSLKDSMADAQGDISTLSKTATDVTSELEDHTGRLSKVEQTASKQATTLSDLQGNLSQVEQKADSNTTTISSINKNAMQDRGVITDAKASFDSLTQLGTYSIKAISLPKMPEQHYGTLAVSGSAGSGWISQQFVADTTGNVYTRVFSNNAWSAWKQGGSQDAINQVKQTADSNSATIRNVQGDVSTLKQTATGVEAALADHEGDIHTLQADDKSLKESIADAQGDISTLSKTATDLDSEMKDHAGRLSKVEQSAATQATTLSDLQGNLTQVKQQADGLVTTLKDAQGSITQIQQKADGTLEQLKSAQGDIASLQTDVTGIKATLTSHEGDIHTLQADSKTLKDDMQDAQGDISTLKKTSTDVVSELKNHAGRISKTEQTATGTQQTVANQQGQINNIKTDAAGIHETLTGQGNQIANINVTLSGLNTKYEGVSGDLNNLKSQAQWVTVTSAVDLNNVKTPCHEFLKGAVTNAPSEVAWWYLTVEGSEGNRITQTAIADQSNNRYTRRLAADWSAWVRDATQTDVTNLSNQITTNSTQITQNQQAIALKADQSTVKNLSGEVSQNTAQLKVQADQISSKVSSADFGALNDRFNNMQIGGRNLLTNTDNDISVTSHITDSWPAWANIDTGFSFEHGKTYTFSAEATNSTDKIAEASIRVFENSTNTQVGIYAFPADGKRHSITFSIPNDSHNYHLLLYAGHAGIVPGVNITTTYHHSKLEEGNVATDWTPAPEDLTTAIQKNATAIDQTNKQISLKADQTEVDTVKGTAQQNSSRLDVMDKMIQSKVTSTDVNNIVDGKGYATTSSVQSLITQKAGTISESITNLDTKVKLGMENSVQLVQKSDFEDGNKGGWTAQCIVSATNPAPPAELGQSGMKVLQTNVRDSYEDDILYSVKPGEKFDVDFWCAPSAAFVSNFGLAFADKNKNNWSWSGVGTDNSGQWKHYTGTITAPATAAFAKPWFQMEKPANNTTNTSWIAKPSIRRQNASTVSAIQSVQASVDGLKSTVASKADESQVTQLSNLVQSKVSSSDFNSKITQLANDINLRVTKGDLITQFNLEAGRTLIQSNKIYFDADSFVMSPNSKAFIPSAYITEINADKITTGTLDAAKLNVKNFSADNIVGGTLSGVVVKTGDNDRYFQTSKNNIYWVRNGSMSLIGNDTYLNSTNGLSIADMNNIQLTTWGGATVGKDGSITNNSGNYGHPKVIIDREGNFNADYAGGETFAYGPGNSEIVQWVNEKEYTNVIRGQGFFVHLDDGNNKSKFSIQKDNKIGFYVGGGDNGDEVAIVGNGVIRLQGPHIDDGSNDTTHTLGNLQVDNLHVRNWLGVDKNKNAIVKTSQGTVAINAYETAEYYFGDIGEGQTDSNGVAYIGIEKLFNETVNTSIPYQVFITAYGPGNVWVEQREQDRFIVKSSQPNIEFGWEIKAKRKGYEHTRLQNVDNKLNHMEATS